MNMNHAHVHRKHIVVVSSPAQRWHICTAVDCMAHSIGKGHELLCSLSLHVFEHVCWHINILTVHVSK